MMFYQKKLSLLKQRKVANKPIKDGVMRDVFGIEDGEVGNAMFVHDQSIKRIGRKKNHSVKRHEPSIPIVDHQRLRFPLRRSLIKILWLFLFLYFISSFNNLVTAEDSDSLNPLLVANELTNTLSLSPDNLGDEVFDNIMVLIPYVKSLENLHSVLHYLRILRVFKTDNIQSSNRLDP
ncbi:hypothetical protein QYF36_024771 [Acer negundo]|nr:hypothetical protein QYF36_024771 [Acer negundo]